MIARPASFAPVEAAAATGGRLEAGTASPERWSGVATDTRDALAGRLFVALKGLRFDAHDFLRQAVDAGAAGLLVSEGPWARIGGRDAVGEGVDVLVVPDSMVGLGDLARAHRRRVGVPVLGLTGSNGKTTTKELMGGLLAQRHRVHMTAGNLNNLIGLPLTLLGLDAELHDVCVVEMGMNALGEIAALTAIAEPELGLITNIGPAHIGELGSLAAIAQAKGELFAGLGPKALAVVNADDVRVGQQLPPGRRSRSFGRAPRAEVRLIEQVACEQGQDLRLSVDGIEVEARLPLHGIHNALNAAAAVAATTALPSARIGAEEVAAGLGGVQATKGRLSVRSLAGLTVIDDTYNANAASALAAVRTAKELAGGRRLVAAFGEMKELGRFSDDAHAEVGAALAEAGAAVVAAFGPGAGPLARAAAANGALTRHEPEDFDVLCGWFLPRTQPGDVLLLKGSRSSRMERILAALEDIS